MFRDSGGVLLKGLPMRLLDGELFLSRLSSDPDSLGDMSSASLLLDLFSGDLIFEDRSFSDLRGGGGAAADHAPQEEPPSRLILGRSLREDL